MTTPPRILALWSAPRSRSTAFLRMMVERGDFLVIHEPFSHCMDFGEAMVGSDRVRSEPELIEAILDLSRQTPVFFKDTTDFYYPYLLTNSRFLREATHTFILRHPAPVIASHFALNPALTCAEVGIERLAEIYDAAAIQAGRAPVVIDSEDLIRRPHETVAAYCGAVGIPPLPGRLAWQPGVLPEWERTSRWHASTAASSGFSAQTQQYPHGVHNNPVLARYLRHHLPHYQRLWNARLTLPVAAHQLGPHPVSAS
ncbi:MAG TPA: hypothetical protein VFC19_16725 [Candidatus Limnocylindrales bacterium]|nr:hypothetical protein [Candidatus Limnocylindrales bacterium]